MERKRSVLHSYDQLIASNRRPRRGRSSSRQLPSQVLQDESLPTERSLQIDKNKVHHLDSIAATPEHMRSQRMLDEDTVVLSTTMTPGWKKYLDQTFQLPATKRSQISTRSDNSHSEQSETLEDVLKSPDKQVHFQHRRKNVVPKGVGTEVFGAAFDSPKAKSQISTRGDNSHTEQTENLEDGLKSPDKQVHFRHRRRNVVPKGVGTEVFGAAFDSPKAKSQISTRGDNSHSEQTESLEDGLKSPDKQVHFRHRRRNVVPKGVGTEVFGAAFDSPKAKSQISTRGDNSHSEQTESLEDRLKSPDKQVHFQHRRKNVVPKGVGTEVFGAAFDSPKEKSSALPPVQLKRNSELSVDNFEEISPILIQPFKRQRRMKADPSVFKDVFKGFASSSSYSMVDVPNRLEESRRKSVHLSASSPENSRSVNELRQKSARLSALLSEDGRSINELRRKSARLSALLSEDGRSINELRRKSARLSVSSPDNNKSGSEHTHTLEQQSGTKRKVEIKTASISKFFNKGQTELENLSATAPETNKPADESAWQSANLSVTASENERSGDESRQKSASLSDTASENNREADELTQKSASLSATTPENNRSGSEVKQKSSSSSVIAAENGKSGDESRQKSANLSATPPESNRSGSEVKQKSSSLSVIATENGKSGDESRRKSASLSATAPESNRSENEHTHTLEQQSGTKRKVDINTPSISKFFSKGQTELESLSATAPENNKPADESAWQSANLSVTASENKRSGSEVKQKSSSLSVTAAENGKSGDESRRKSASLSATAPESNRSENEHTHTLKKQSGTKRKVDINTTSISKFFNKGQTELESMVILPGPSSHSREMKQDNMHKPTQDRHSTFNKSVRPQSAPWVRRRQEKTAATKNVCAFNLLSRVERSTKLQELVSEVKKKHDEALKSKLVKGLFSREPQEVRDLEENVTVRKRTGGRKPTHPALLVNGKPYRPRLKRPKSWVTPRLYKLLIPKCEEKYGMLKARRKAEEFAVFLCEKVSTVIRRKKYENYESILEEIKRALYKHGIIKCLMEYFVFIEDYLPFEYRIKAIPCLRSYGKRTGPPLAPDTDLFADLCY